MSNSLYKLIRDQILAKQLEMMEKPVGSVERIALIQDIREMERRLHGQMQTA